jgi:hypothetical protein
MSKTGDVHQLPTARRLRDPAVYLPNAGLWVTLDDSRGEDRGLAGYGPGSWQDQAVERIADERGHAGGGGSSDTGVEADAGVKALEAALLLMFGIAMAICCLIAIPVAGVVLLVSTVGRLFRGRA